MVSSPLDRGEVSTFSTANAIHNFPGFFIYQVPITVRWAEAVWHEKLARHLSTWPSSGNRTPGLILSPTLYPLGYVLGNMLPTCTGQQNMGFYGVLQCQVVYHWEWLGVQGFTESLLRWWRAGWCLLGSWSKLIIQGRDIVKTWALFEKIRHTVF